jgi:hypothetical protein
MFYPSKTQPTTSWDEGGGCSRACQGGKSLIGLRVEALTGVINDPPTWSSRGAGPKARLDHLSLWSVKGGRPAGRMLGFDPGTSDPS